MYIHKHMEAIAAPSTVRRGVDGMRNELAKHSKCR